MKSNEKRGILILIVVALIVVMIIYGVTKQRNSNENTGTEQGQIQALEGFKLSDVQLKSENGKTTIIANVTNKSGEDKGILQAYIVLFDENYNELERIPTTITATKNGQTIQVRTSMPKEFKEVKEYKLIEK